ncbi:HAD family hydrolase [Nocardioides aquiterrae]|uniref:Haloacid dehalogenase-like hydrolase n=1 Tax=Nocardioides aquiterrae TaxID=203799 RepID=A0ABP4EXE1_9ACTN
MTATERRLVLWDIDGTLISNDDNEEVLFVRALEAVVGPVAEVVHPYRHGKTDLQQVTEYLLANGGSADDVAAGSRSLVEVSEAHFATPGERIVQPGVRELIAALAEAGHVNALLTGNGPVRARLKLQSAALDAGDFDFERSFFGAESAVRPELAHAAAALAAEEGLVPVIIGDTAADGRAAADAGIGFVGVATGVYGVDQLREVPHLVVVEDLATGAAAVLSALAGR